MMMKRTTSAGSQWCAAVAALALLATLAATQGAAAQVRLPSIISDHMVLQSDAKATIWGWAKPGEHIQVAPSWSGSRPRSATTDADGLWTIQIDTPAAGGPHTLEISGAGGNVTINDVLVGEVWVCGGQSNMEMTVDNIGAGGPGIDSAAAIASRADHPQLRYFDVPNVLSVSPVEQCEGQWVVCSPQTVGPFSAVGYFFGLSLRDHLDRPVGLIGSNWGGTRVEAWMSEDVLRSLGVCADQLDFLEVVRRDPGLPERQLKERIDQWWKHALATDSGSKASPNWSSDTFDDSSWETATLPGAWDATPATAFDGIVWYRRTFEAPPGSQDAGATLQLGPIDDMDTVWINAARIGGKEEGGNWFVPRNYEVPAGVLRGGSNSITIRALDTGGAGGLMGADNDVKLIIHRKGAAAGALGANIALAGTWRTHRGASMQELGPWPFNAAVHANSPSVLFNGMIVPIERYAVRGAIWYQGESNRDNAWDYRRLFPAMIRNWRDAWGADAARFPFYFVQIAPFGYWGENGETPVVRESQWRSMQTTPNTGMAVTMDVGNVADIHPKNKKAVGERLALWALSQTYGREVGEYAGPLYESMTLADGKAEITFTHADGLKWSGGEPVGFAIAGSDRQFVAAQARIDGDRILVWSPAVALPAAVRYGWDDDAQPNLFNGADLPAAPFRTDDWPVATQP